MSFFLKCLSFLSSGFRGNKKAKAIYISKPYAHLDNKVCPRCGVGHAVFPSVAFSARDLENGLGVPGCPKCGLLAVCFVDKEEYEAMQKEEKLD